MRTRRLNEASKITGECKLDFEDKIKEVDGTTQNWQEENNTVVWEDLGVTGKDQERIYMQIIASGKDEVIFGRIRSIRKVKERIETAEMKDGLDNRTAITKLRCCNMDRELRFQRTEIKGISDRHVSEIEEYELKEKGLMVEGGNSLKYGNLPNGNSVSPETKASPDERRMEATPAKRRSSRASTDNDIEVEEIVVNSEPVFGSMGNSDGVLDPCMLCSVEIPADGGSSASPPPSPPPSKKQKISKRFTSSNPSNSKQGGPLEPTATKAESDSDIEEIAIINYEDGTGYVSQSAMCDMTTKTSASDFWVKELEYSSAWEKRENWDMMAGVVGVSIDNLVMVRGRLSRDKVFLGQVHYHLELQRWATEDSGGVVFSMHNDAMDSGRMKARCCVDGMAGELGMGDLIRIKDHRMTRSGDSGFAADPPVESPLVRLSITGTTSGIRKLPTTVMGDGRAVAGETVQMEATEDRIKAGDSKEEGEEGKEEPGAALMERVQLLGLDPWLGRKEG
jgi:hypothetical protein